MRKMNHFKLLAVISAMGYLLMQFGRNQYQPFEMSAEKVRWKVLKSEADYSYARTVIPSSRLMNRCYMNINSFSSVGDNWRIFW
jgi:hypothetical protein